VDFLIDNKGLVVPVSGGWRGGGGRGGLRTYEWLTRTCGEAGRMYDG